ncbi:MAG: J domain-containing protein [Nitrospirota bacterium]|nr:J domain-containing protein [Nitrospirota bacterium]
MNDTSIDAYPLQWPAGWKRTTSYQRRTSKFADKSFAVARDYLMAELKRFGATNIILSTNDGLPYSGYRQPDDTGVAVYFQKSQGWDKPKKSMVFACDQWRKIEENIYAIFKTIEALRGIERWGSSDLMERSFTGFTALPPAPPAKRDWWDVLGVPRHSSKEHIKARYRELAAVNHPDFGGSHEAMTLLNRAYEEAMR